MAGDYITDLEYVPGYFPELSIPRLNLALLARGIGHTVPISPTYLELGFGQGLSLAIHAATSSGAWYGTDFNAAHAANASRLAAATGKSISILDDSFDALARRADLPQFDVIVMHGIWSWISAESRQSIVELVRDRLRPGGILYVSYNCIPGWSQVLPLRHLLNEYAQRAAAGTLLQRIDKALDFLDGFMALGGGYFSANPALADRLQLIRHQDRSYVAHEYFNQNWTPFAFSDVQDALAPAKLQFAASANLIENIENIFLSRAHLDLLSAIPDQGVRETAKDYVLNQQFRRDIFVKGARQLNPAEHLATIANLPFRVTAAEEVRPSKVRTPLGEADLRADIYDVLFDALAREPEAIITHRQLSDRVAGSGMTPWQLWEAMLVLTSVGHLGPASLSATPDEDREAALALNRMILDHSSHGGTMAALAAPAIGGGVAVGRIEQMLLKARAAGSLQPAADVWQVLKAQGERLLKDGTALESEDDNLAELDSILARLVAVSLPVLHRLGVV